MSLHDNESIMRDNWGHDTDRQPVHHIKKRKVGEDFLNIFIDKTLYSLFFVPSALYNLSDLHRSPALVVSSKIHVQLNIYIDYLYIVPSLHSLKVVNTGKKEK